MNIVIATDLAHEGGPEPSYALWLRSSHAHDQWPITATHVIEHSLRSVLASIVSPEVDPDVLANKRLTSVFAPADVRLRLVDAPTVADGLRCVCNDEQAELLVMSRHSSRGLVWSRLGRSVRQTIHDLPCALGIVPPKWSPSPATDGPIAVLCQPNDDPRIAQFGARIAKARGRDLVLAHVVEDPAVLLLNYDTGPAIEQACALRLENAKQDFSRWAADLDLGLSNVRIRVELGDTRITTSDLLAELRSPTLVMGVTGHHWLALGSDMDLASHLPIPVILVPAHRPVVSS